MSCGRIATIVLAAGAGSRSGGCGHLTELNGRPMLTRVLETVAAAAPPPHVVVLGAAADVVTGAVPAGWTTIVAAAWDRGPGASLRAGLTAVPGAESALIVLGDLPWLRTAAIRRVLAALTPGVIAARATDDGRPGHPVAIGPALIDAARNAPDAGLAGLLRSAATLAVPCDGLGVTGGTRDREVLAARK